MLITGAILLFSSLLNLESFIQELSELLCQNRWISYKNVLLKVKLKTVLTKINDCEWIYVQDLAAAGYGGKEHKETVSERIKISIYKRQHR